MNEEYKFIQENKTWVLIPLAEDAKPIIFLHETKMDSKGKV